MNFAHSSQSFHQILLWTILNFWTKFVQGGYLWSKTEEVNIIIEFRIFKLFLVPNLSINWQFWFFRSDLPRKSFSGLKQKKVDTTIEFFIVKLVPISAQTDNFEFLDQIYPKRVFPVKNRTSSPSTTSVCFLCSKSQFNCCFWAFWRSQKSHYFKHFEKEIGCLLPPRLFLYYNCIKLFKQHCANSHA